MNEMPEARGSDGPETDATELYSVETELRHLIDTRLSSGITPVNVASLVQQAAAFQDVSRQTGDTAGRTLSLSRLTQAVRRALIQSDWHDGSGSGGSAPPVIELHDDPGRTVCTVPQLQQLDLALQRLAAEDPQAATVAECRLFAGMSLVDCSAVLELPEQVVWQAWTYGRAWLQCELSAPDVRPECVTDEKPVDSPAGTRSILNKPSSHS